ncbi:hypothetical protein C4D60_Mb10t19700 [Musa balbisiana]|uniref:Uncharacterized protein n=1 Tax=Musa balbisiana TaxID=52838 RepID=A0A4S8IYD5_MUSBA|nr:hypothetical protein C4D60_Mb10t19700 [Musa balbisiana]
MGISSFLDQTNLIRRRSPKEKPLLLRRRLVWHRPRRFPSLRRCSLR